MKKVFKIVLIIFCILVLWLVLDLISTFTRNKPLFVLREEERVDKGLFFDVYNCPEYSFVQIKMKGSKFSCAIINDENVSFEIIDETEVCAEALEEIYKDDEYVYYLSCIKSGNMKVVFSDGRSYSLKEVLEKEILTIDELIDGGLKVYKYPVDE